MNIQQFQYVLAVVKQKNFEAAAEQCFVSQSTLSTMIGRFEEEIGIKLFNRKTKPVSITVEGEQVINRLRIIANEIDALHNVVQELKGEMKGELRIGIIPTIAPYLLPLFLTQFASESPQVTTIVREMTTSELQRALKNRSLDIGIAAIPLADPQLIEQELYSEPFLIYDCRTTAYSKRVNMYELDFTKLMLLQEGHCLRTQVQQICELSSVQANPSLNYQFESGSMDSLLRFTRANQGLTILPYLTASALPQEEKARLIGFKPPVPARTVGLLTHEHFVRKRLLTRLQAIITTAIGQIITHKGDIEVLKPT